MTGAPRRLARRLRQADLPILVGLAGLVYAAWRGWVEPPLHHSLGAFDLGVMLPGTDRRPISFGLVLLAAAVLCVVAMVPAVARRRLALSAAAGCALFAAVGFLLQGCFADRALQHRLENDRTDLLTLQRVAGFRIPRPELTSLGPIPLTHSAAEVVSSLRSGFYAALASGVLLGCVAVARRRHEPTRRHLVLRLAALAAGVLVAANIAVATAAAYYLHQARTAAATGRNAAAAEDYHRAFGLERGPHDPTDAAAYGLVSTGTGADSTEWRQLAQSRIMLAAGHDLDALRMLADACRRAPRDPVLQEEFARQAEAMLFLRNAPATVRGLMPAGVADPVLFLTLARFDITTADYAAAITDSREAVGSADDTEVRSIGLTFLGIAQARAGDPVLGRRTLREAAAADTEHLNVMARSLLTGLYITIPL